MNRGKQAEPIRSRVVGSRSKVTFNLVGGPASNGDRLPEDERELAAIKMTSSYQNNTGRLAPVAKLLLHLLLASAATLSTWADQHDPDLGFEPDLRAREPRDARLDRRSNEPECPSNRLAQSLLPVEYLGSPASSQRPSMSRAYCDCTPDLLGWQLTCFAGAAQSGTGSGSSAGSAAAPLPDQLHPAFRGPQIQRMQQQAAVVNRGRPPARIRRAARWMGKLGAGSGSANDSAEEPDETRSTTSHEGFGDDSLASPILTTTRPDARTQPAKKLATLKLAQVHHRQQQQSTNSSGYDDSFISLPSSDTFTTIRRQQQDSEKLSANNNINNHLMFQTVPVLFSVKYVRNTMIEIDCDQAAPNYKPAMFQGKSTFGKPPTIVATFHKLQQELQNFALSLVDLLRLDRSRKRALSIVEGRQSSSSPKRQS